jgi:NADH pyrophosphatase NudC (nudix superfamily)
MSKDTYCSHCGKVFAEQKLYPRKCFFCGNDTYANPLPVVVVMATVEWIRGAKARVMLIQRRNIEPKKGEWALISGYINLGETWQEAASRELEEEMYLQASDFKLWDVCLSSNKNNLLIFCTTHIKATDFYKSAECFEPNDEVQEIDAIELLPSVAGHFKSANGIHTRELVFPAHAKYAEEFIIKEIGNGN